VWVRQEHLKELLDTRPRDRQTRLDELFGLSDYNTAWTNIANYQRDYETEKRVYEKDPDVVGMEKLSTEYNRTVEEFSLVEIELNKVAKRLDEAKKALEEADLKLKKLEELKQQLEKLRQRETEALVNLKNLEDTSESLAEKIEAKKNTIENLNQRLNVMETQVKS
jgi:DNA repair exonuclease SbcCD ATPase subunit